MDGAPPSRKFGSIRAGNHAAIALNRRAIGSLGAVVELADGRLAAITAGHVVQRHRDVPLEATTVTSRVSLGTTLQNAAGAEAIIYSENGDLALIGPIADDVTAISGDPLVVRDPTQADINQCVWVYVARDFAPAGAFVHNVDVPVAFQRIDGPGEIRFQHFIEIDRVTDPNDSGAPVLDEFQQLIGFVVGATDLRTYLMPAQRGLNELEALLG